MHARCADLPSIKNDLSRNLQTYSPGRAASAQRGYEDIKTICACTTKQCLTSAMLEQQTHEQNECTIHSTAVTAQFEKVGERTWVSKYGPEGICQVVSVFTFEHEPSSTSLWTYTEQYTYMNRSADEFCKAMPSSETSVYSWKSGNSVRLQCEEIRFDANPEW